MHNPHTALLIFICSGAIDNGIQSCRNNATRHVRHGRGVDCVHDFGAARELYGALEETDQEVVCVGDALLGAEDVAWAEDAAAEAATAGFADELFGDPFGLAVSTKLTLAYC